MNLMHLYCEVFYFENLNGRAIFLIFDHKTPSGNQSEQKTYKAIASPTPAAPTARELQTLHD